MLSNTATPIYYRRFRDAVMRGDIPVNYYISLEMNRIDQLVDNPNMYYDDQAVEGFIAFCNNELTLRNGSPFKMLDSFKLWAEQLFGWYYFEDRTVPVEDPKTHRLRYVRKKVKRRLTRVQYLIEARGSAKSMYDYCVQAYGLVVDTSTTDQITVAPTMQQANEVMAPFKTAITMSRGPVFKMLTYGSINNTTGSKANRVKLASTKDGIKNFMNNSHLHIRPLNIDKLQGLGTKYNTLDEWLSGDIRENPIEAIEQGAAKTGDYVIVCTSSEGTVRNGIGDTIKMELISILKGEYINPHVSIWYYRLDDVKEVSDPNMWIKANPNLGYTCSYETYQLAVEKAEKVPSERNDILAKRFGIPLEGYTYFFTYEETQTHRFRNFNGMVCAMGADLSLGDDFCAFTFLFPLRNDEFGVKTRCYISDLTYRQLPEATREKYDEFLREGSLVVMDCTVLDMMEVYEDLDNYIIDHEYTVEAFGYDPYNAEAFVNRWISENGPFGIEKVRQGHRTESVPLGELKKLALERMLLFDEELMKYAMGNCIVLEDTNGNRKLYRKRKDQKIDAVAAMMDAFVAYKLNKESFE